MSTAPPPTRTALTLPSDPQSPGRARRFAADYVRHCAPAASDDHIDSVLLVVSELVTNACKYGADEGDSVQLVLDVTAEHTRIEVHDPNRRRPWARSEADRQRRNHGNGLHIIRALCGGRWGVGSRPMGKYVWAVIRCES